MTPSVVHVLPGLTRGGPTRAVLAAIAALGERDDAPAPRFISLRPADPAMADLLAGLGIPLLDAPGPDALHAELAAADLVQIEFWNSPETYDLLRGELPPMRLVIWFVIGGGTAPQVVLPELLEIADLPLAAGPTVVGADRREDLEAVQPVLDPRRSGPRDSVDHAGYVVGYLGTVDRVKMHPEFVAMSAAVTTPGVRFPVYGSGGGFDAIGKEAERLGVADRFELGGFVEDVAGVLAGFDVFGYPLCRENYSTTDQVLMEAMSAGVPPVVLPYGGPGRIVEDGVAGIVARDERDYTEALERLASDRELRRRLGDGARSYAERTWSPAAGAAAWTAAYSELLERPKRKRSWPGGPAGSGAEALLDSLGELDGPLRSSFEAGSVEAAEADAAIAGLPPTLARGDGGVLDYRRRFPGDPFLRLWAGIVLEAMDRPALAAGEFAAAARLGLQAERTKPRLEALGVAS